MIHACPFFSLQKGLMLMTSSTRAVVKRFSRIWNVLCIDIQCGVCVQKLLRRCQFNSSYSNQSCNEGSKDPKRKVNKNRQGRIVRNSSGSQKKAFQWSHAPSVLLCSGVSLQYWSKNIHILYGRPHCESLLCRRNIMECRSAEGYKYVV